MRIKILALNSMEKKCMNICYAKLNYDCLRQVISYDTLRVVMMCLRHSLKLQGNHIITFGEAKFITLNS